MDLVKEFKELPPDTGQQEIQKKLAEIHKNYHLQAAMGCMFAWSLKAGYITREKLKRTERLIFHDEALRINFRIQINYARSKYRPKPPQDSKLPPMLCTLCKENVGRPGKESLRIYEFPMGNRMFFLQLTPFPLFPFHFVPILSRHIPQAIDRQSVVDMFSFLCQAPDYTVCSNSDVEWAGSSILEHLHFQVFKDLRLPVMEAESRPGFTKTFADCSVSLLNYPLTALKVIGKNERSVTEAVSQIIDIWKDADPGRNTVNLVLFKKDDELLYFIFLRNPDYRTPENLRRFKEEGVGVIEATGEGILPVPAGDEAEEIWKYIRSSGLDLMKSLLSGNNPVKSTERIKEIFGGKIL